MEAPFEDKVFRIWVSYFFINESLDVYQKEFTNRTGTYVHVRKPSGCLQVNN